VARNIADDNFGSVEELRPRFDVYGELPRIDLGADFPTLQRVSKRLQLKLRQLHRYTTPEGVTRLADAFAARECPSLDYETMAYDFAYVYFLQNFWKAALLFHRSTILARTILDLGTGSGATALAYLTSLNDFLREQGFKINPKFEVHVTFLDRSRKQLRLASELLAEISAEWRNLTVFPHYEIAEIADWKPKSHFDVVLMGHVLNENRTHITTILDRAFELADSNARLFVIERNGDPCWEQVQSGVSQLALPYAEGRVAGQIQFFRPLRSRLGRGLSSTESRYVILRCPEEKVLVNLLRKYFRAWSTRSKTLLNEVFTETAEYYEKPFSRPLCGLQAIQKYWEDRVLPQKNIKIRILRVAYTSLDAFAEWESRFAIGNTRVDVRGCLVLRLDSSSQRIARLSEYYGSVKK